MYNLFKTLRRPPKPYPVQPTLLILAKWGMSTLTPGECTSQYPPDIEVQDSPPCVHVSIPVG